MEIGIKKALECCKETPLVTVDEAQKTRILVKTGIVKVRLRRFLLGIRIPSPCELETMCYALYTFSLCPETLQETEIKNSVLIWWRKFQGRPTFMLGQNYRENQG